MWKSRIDSSLTPLERQVLAAYRQPAAPGFKRAVRLSVQYAIGTGIFVLLCISQSQPYWCLVVYATFLAQMAVRLIGARKIGDAMPSVISKYETRIAELEAISPTPQGAP